MRGWLLLVHDDGGEEEEEEEEEREREEKRRGEERRGEEREEEEEKSVGKRMWCILKGKELLALSSPDEDVLLSKRYKLRYIDPASIALHTSLVRVQTVDGPICLKATSCEDGSMWRRSIQDGMMPNQNIPLNLQDLKEWLKEKEQSYKTGSLSLKTFEHLLENSVLLLNRCVEGTDGLNACHVACTTVGSTTPLLAAIMTASERASREQDDRGCIPFYHLVKCFPMVAESMSWMVENFARDIRVVNKEGNNLLHRMAKNRYLDFDMFKLMVNITPGGLTCLNKNGWTVLHYICRYHGGNIQAIQLCLWNFPKACMMATSDGWLPLHFLARYFSDQIASVRMLMTFNDKAADVKNDKGWLPLHHACRHDITKDVLIELLTPQASEMQTPGGFTAFHLLVLHNSTKRDVIHHYLTYNPRVAMIAAKSEVTPLHSLLITNRGNNSLISLLVKTCPQVCRHADSSGYIPYQYLSHDSELSWATRQLLESVSMQCMRQDENRLQQDIVRILFPTSQHARQRKDSTFFAANNRLNDGKEIEENAKEKLSNKAEKGDSLKIFRMDRKKLRKLKNANGENSTKKLERTGSVKEVKDKGENGIAVVREDDKTVEKDVLLATAYGQSVPAFRLDVRKKLKTVDKKAKSLVWRKNAASALIRKTYPPITVVRTNIRYVEKVINQEVVCENFVVLPPPPMFETLRLGDDDEEKTEVNQETRQDRCTDGANPEQTVHSRQTRTRSWRKAANTNDVQELVVQESLKGKQDNYNASKEYCMKGNERNEEVTSKVDMMDSLEIKNRKKIKQRNVDDDDEEDSDYEYNKDDDEEFHMLKEENELLIRTNKVLNLKMQTAQSLRKSQQLQDEISESSKRLENISAIKLRKDWNWLQTLMDEGRFQDKVEDFDFEGVEERDEETFLFEY